MFGQSEHSVLDWRFRYAVRLRLPDSALAFAARRRLALLNTMALSLLAGSVAAPLLMAAGAPRPANALYRFFHLLCRQSLSRSFFIRDRVATVSHEQLRTLGIDSRSFVGNDQMGWKMALCERCLGMTVGVCSFGFTYAATKRNLRPARFAWFALLVAPLGLDGLTQRAGWRESNWPLRVTTGMLFGVASAWFLYPRLLQGNADRGESEP